MTILRNLLGNKLHSLPLVVLYLTDGCNSRCVTCDIWRNPRLNMAMNLAEEIAGACEALNVRWVLLSGGEAMQHPEWGRIARLFKDQGIYTMLLTNGLLLRKQIDVVAASVDEVIVSLDGGTPDTYQAIRGVDGFDLIMEGIQLCREQAIPVTTRTTVQRANYQEIPTIIQAGKAADVNSISFLTVDVSNEFAFGARFEPDPALVMIPTEVLQKVQSPALTVDDIPILEKVLDEVEQRFGEDFQSGLLAESPQKLRRMVRYFQAVIGATAFDPPRCNAPHISTIIEVDGTLRPCYFLPAYGKLNGQGLKTALNIKGAQALRQAYRAGQRPECERCVCPLYKGPRALLKM